MKNPYSFKLRNYYLSFALALGLVIAALIAISQYAKNTKDKEFAHSSDPAAVIGNDSGQCRSPGCNHGKPRPRHSVDEEITDPDATPQDQATAISEKTSLPQVNEAELQPFKNWLTEWQAGRGKLEEGVRLAKQQEPVMLQMIDETPDLAYSHAMMEKDWKKLPAGLRAHVAHRFTRTGEYSKIHICFSEKASHQITAADFSTNNASISPTLAEHNDYKGNLSGVALGKTYGLVAMEGGAEVDPIEDYDIAYSAATGAIKVLWLSIKASDQSIYPDSISSTTGQLNTVAANFAAWSYGKMSVTYDIEEVAIPSASGASHTTIRSEANSATSYNTGNYDIVLYRTTWEGNWAYIGGSIVMMKKNAASTIIHEMGHCMGLSHSNFWVPNAGEPAWGAGKNKLYGENWDAMANSPRGDFNAYEKRQLGWLDATTEYKTNVSSGIYRIYPYDSRAGNFSASGVNGAYYMVSVFKDTRAVNGESADRRYALSFRNQPEKGNGPNAWYAQGLQLHWEPWTYTTTDSGGGPFGTTVIDTKVRSASLTGANEVDDAPLLVGETYVDNDPGNRDGDIFITVLSKTDPDGVARSGDEYMDVKIVIGDQIGNQSPTCTLTANVVSAQVGQAVTFTATASDPDDTKLAYLWDFGLGTNSNARKAMPLNGASTQTFSWSAEGNYTVSVTVSDGRGGTITKTIDFFVGTPEVVLSSSSYYVDEAAGTVTLTVNRKGVTLGEVSVDYATADGSATNGLDYTAASGTLTWTDGDSADKTIVIDVINDGNTEGSEDFTVTLSNATGTTLGSPSSAWVMITDEGTDPSLLAHWKFDESSGTLAEDSAGPYDGSFVGTPTWQPSGGIIGGALSFNGSNAHVDVSSAASALGGLSGITVSMWVKADAANVDKGFLHDAVADGSDNEIGCRYDSAGGSGGGTQVLKCTVTTSGGAAQLESSSNVQTTEWQYVVMTWKSGQALSLYLDGILDTPSYTTGAKTGTVSAPPALMIGAGPKARWAGLVDDVRIYNRALTPTEINDLYLTGNPTLPENYVAWINAGGFANAFTATGLTDNPDGDSSNNLMEFALGTDPTLRDAGSLAIDGSVNGSPVPVNAGGGVFDYYFVRRKDHGTSGSVSYTVQFSNDLTGFTNSVATPIAVADSGADPDYEVVKVPFPSGFRFGRLQIETAP